MDNSFFSTIFKRKSFHLFMNCGYEVLSQDEIDGISELFERAERLYPDIRMAIRIVPTTEVTLKRGAEYCILIYSEKKPNYLMNVGYVGEQLDLYLQKNNIASLWYGLGKPDKEIFDGLDYVIMFAIRKVSDETKYRKNIEKTTRKSIGEIWKGDMLGIAETARYAPSACNSQPWVVENIDGVVTVTRYKKQAKIGLLTPKAAFYFNRIDIGIFLCVLEICFAEKNISFKRELYVDETDTEYSPVAKYHME